MRRLAAALLVLLLAWNVGMQPVLAQGLSCTHAQAATHSDATPSADAEHSAHRHHAPAGTTDAAAVAHDAMSQMPGCHCGCACGGIGCVSGAPGLPAQSAGGLLAAGTTGLFASEVHAAQRAAHGIDLLRPPSRS